MHPTDIQGLCYCASLQKLLSTSHDGVIHKWAIGPTGQVALDALEGHTKRVNSMSTAAGGRLLATASDDAVRVWNVDQARQLHVHSPAGAGREQSQAVANYSAPPPSSLLLTERREDVRGGPSFAMLHVFSGALISTLEVLPPCTQLARASDLVVRAQPVVESRGRRLGESSRLLLLTAANNTLQLVGEESGRSKGNYAPGRYERRMLGMARGSSDPNADKGAVLVAAAAAAVGVGGLPAALDQPNFGGCVYVPALGCSLVCWSDGTIDALEVGVGRDDEEDATGSADATIMNAGSALSDAAPAAAASSAPGLTTPTPSPQPDSAATAPPPGGAFGGSSSSSPVGGCRILR